MLKKVYFSSLVFILLASASMAQCTVDIGTDTIFASCGQSTYISALGLSDTPALSTDFDGNQIGAGWSSSGTLLYNNPCGPSLDGTPSAWFGNVPFPRTLTTNGFDMSCGGQVCFDLDFGGDDNATSNCEDPDLIDEGVYFQYSINGGATWVTLFYFEPTSNISGPYYSWANYCYTLPAIAWTANTMFQWSQPNASSTVNDHWGIDNVSIIPTNCGFWYDWDNLPAANDGYDQTVNPNINTTYIVNYTDGVVGCLDTVVVSVEEVVAQVTASSTSISCLDCADLNIEFTNYNAGSIIDDFDPGVNMTMWSDIQSGTPSNSCNSMSGNALFFDGTGAERSATTVAIDATSCGTMNFCLFIGNTGSAFPCENADAGEDVVFQYSTNGGTTWSVITTYYESTWDANNSWQCFTIFIPPFAQTTSTMFRWVQTNFTSGVGSDTWALDDVYYSCTPPPFDFVWTPAPTLSDATVQAPQACPLDVTTYVGTITDPTTGCTASDSITIQVTCDCMFAAITTDVSDCENGNEFTVSGEFMYIDNPITGTIEIEVTNASGTYIQSIPGPFVDQTLFNYSVSGIIADGSPITVTIYFSDEQTCISVLNDISPVLPEVLSVLGGGVYCFGDPITDITVDVTGNGPWTIDFTLDGTAQTMTGIASPINLGNAQGEYIVTNVSDAGCTNTAVGIQSIVEQDVPTVSSVFGGNTYCQYDLVDGVLVTVVGTAPWTIDYTLNGIPNSITSSTDTTSLGNAPGTYIVTGVTDAACSNTAAGMEVITVHAAPIVGAGMDFISCEFDQVTLSGSGAQSYDWDNSVTNNVAFVPASTITYTVIGTDVNGCVGTDDIMVIVEPLPIVSFIADSMLGCEPFEVIFTNTTIASSDLLECIWDFGDNNSGVGCDTIGHQFEYGGLYDISLQTTTINGCVNSITYPDFIYVENNPNAMFTASATTVLSLNTEVIFSNDSEGATSYIWDFGDDTEQSTNVNPFHEFPDSQTAGYVVTLYAYSPLGCPDSVTLVVNVNQEIIYYLPNSFTPDGDEFNQTFQPIFTAGYDTYDFNMFIFNRWGEIIWESHDPEMGWDGTYRGKLIAAGTYHWKIEFKTELSDERIIVNGHVNVLR
ncbi:MAG: PKD domain-containing protein [Crocinitomicaceae bacterium]|nr:PKD domain-containing protein [Crocinitomicaceae bacterium]